MSRIRLACAAAPFRALEGMIGPDNDVQERPPELPLINGQPVTGKRKPGTVDVPGVAA